MNIVTTSLIDIIEDELGIDLSINTCKQLDLLDDTDLKSLSRALYTFSKSEWVRVPKFEDDQCFTPHPNSKLTSSLGGIGFGFGLEVPFDHKYMTGSAVTALTYFPRVAVPEGIQYFLDYFRFTGAQKPHHRSTVINILKFYGMCRELIRLGDLVIIPRNIWENSRSVGSHSPEYDNESLKKQLVEYGIFDTEHNIKTDWISEDEITDLLLSGIANEATHEVSNLIQIFKYTGYRPLLTDRKQQLAFENLINPWTNKSISVGSKIEKLEGLFPITGEVNIREFLAARNNDGFSEFRKCMDEISHLSINDLGPISYHEEVSHIFQSGRDNVLSSIRTSPTLTKLFKGAATVAVTVGAGLTGGVLNPSWTDDPLKLLFLSAAGAAGVVGADFIEELISTKRDQETLSLMSVMIDEK